jgi:hypothetical protein
MACTALKITKQDGTIVRIKMMTVWNPPQTDVDLYHCNDDFMPIGNAMMSASPMDEEVYHKELRIQATAKGQFIPEESTDPEWSPGYVEPPEEIEENGSPDPV